MTGASDWGLVCYGFGCRGSQESVEEPVERQFWRKATFKVRAEEQGLQMRLERNGEEGRKTKRMGAGNQGGGSFKKQVVETRVTSYRGNEWKRTETGHCVRQLEGHWYP